MPMLDSRQADEWIGSRARGRTNSVKTAAKAKVAPMTVPLRDGSAGFRLAIAVEGGLAVLAVAVAWTLHMPLLGQMSVANFDELVARIGAGLVATLPLLVMFWWLVRARWAAALRLRQHVERLIDDLFPRASLVQLAVVSAVAGLSEELLFRGVVQPLAARWSTPVVGLVVASIVFGMFHAVSLLYFALATLVGAYFGWLMVAVGSLVPPIVAHGLYDFLALAYLTHQIGSRTTTAGGVSSEQWEAHDEWPGG
jgi:membrane protease YdiL (CAAX protease family)